MVGPGHYKLYQSRSLTPMWGSVPFSLAIPWDTTRTLCLCGVGGGVLSTWLGRVVTGRVCLERIEECRPKGRCLPIGASLWPCNAIFLSFICLATLIIWVGSLGLIVSFRP